MVTETFLDFIIHVNHVPHIITFAVNNEVGAFKPFLHLFSHFVIAFAVTIQTDGYRI